MGNPARKLFVGYGYDPEAYISTAQLAPSPYTTEQLIIGKLGGLNRLITACDDSQPPVGSLAPTIGGQPNPVYLTYQSVLQIATTEINGYLSSIYPCPLAQTGTVGIMRVTGISTDGNEAITAIEVVDVGNYCTAPSTPNSVAYMRHLDAEANEHFWGPDWQCEQRGSGASFSVAFTPVNYSDESGQLLQAQAIFGTPVIVSGGTKYHHGDLLVLTGGSSFVPAMVRQAMLDLVCHTLYKRSLAPDEKNPFEPLVRMWRKLFIEISEGEKSLDGTYKRFFSAASSWNTASVLNGANSL